jgi:uncharacterized protein
MSPDSVVSNAGPLIALEQIGLLELLRDLYMPLLIPPSVRRETARSMPSPPWLVVRALTRPPDARIRASLQEGERDAISLAVEVGALKIILDDRPARLDATRLGLSVIGTLGVLLLAKDTGLLSSIRPRLDELQNHGFYVSADLYHEILRSAGEL